MLTQGAPSTAEVVVEFAGDAAAPGPSLIKPTEPAREVEALPDAIASAVKATLSQELGEASLQVGRYSRETWSDGCLGLGGPAEGCLAALTERWHVDLLCAFPFT